MNTERGGIIMTANAEVLGKTPLPCVFC